MKIVFCGGGTGGHITPMLAMADIIGQNSKEIEFYFIGREGGKENQAIKNAGFVPYEIRVTGLKRRLSFSNVKAVADAVGARKRAKEILREISPDLVIGTGGYVSWPVLSAAKSLGIKCAIHESNAVPGLVTRKCGRWLDLVMLGYPEAEARLPERYKTVITGNPVRRAIGSISRTRARAMLKIPEGKTVVLSFGGSLGSEVMNSTVIEMIERDGGKSGLFFIHATGRGEYEKHNSKSFNHARILPYIDDMPLYLAAADIGIVRCGAMTLAEIEAAGLPSILIPSPNVTANHQYENARALSESGGGILITEAELNAEVLKTKVRQLAEDKNARRRMADTMRDRASGCDRKIIAAIRCIFEQN